MRFHHAFSNSASNLVCLALQQHVKQGVMHGSCAAPAQTNHLCGNTHPTRFFWEPLLSLPLMFHCRALPPQFPTPLAQDCPWRPSTCPNASTNLEWSRLNDELHSQTGAISFRRTEVAETTQTAIVSEIQNFRADRMKILIVCTANICRSPMAEAVLNALAESTGAAGALRFKSAGTHAVRGHIDPRAKLVLKRRGYSVAKPAAQKIGRRGFDDQDLVLAMDHENVAALRRLSPADRWDKVKLFLDFAPGMGGHEIPDPYYGNIEGFERVLDLCEIAATGLLDQLRRSRDSLLG